MIEIIQQTSKTEEKTESRLPKNIRQIGNPEKDFRIYMEDYVYTYLHPAQMPGMEQGIWPRLLILLGEIHHFPNRSCAFISGAVQVEHGGCREDLPKLNEASWRQIHKQMQHFFDKCEVVGWVLDIPGNALTVSREMEEIHRRNFVGNFQFFFLMDSLEREEAFYTWKDGCLSRKDGYFIYYEKNPQMQEYLISRREGKSGERSPTEEGADRAARNYRAMMMEKKEGGGKGKTGFFSHLSSILTVLILCAVSVILLGSIHRMENMEQTISVMSVAMDSSQTKQEDEDREDPQNQVAVETVSGSILPITEEPQNPQLKEPQEPQAEAGETVPEEPAQGQESDLSQAEPAAQGAAGGQQADVSGEITVETSAEPAAGEAEQYLAQGYYIVQAGDSLNQICYNIYHTKTMIGAVCEANQIEDQDTIYAGQKIILP